MILEAAAVSAVVLPVTGWALNKIIQHDRDIAVLRAVVTDIRDSLQHLERILEQSYADDQARRKVRP